MEENAQLIVDKQNRSAYKFSLPPAIHLVNSIWENLVLSKGFFLEISLSVGNAWLLLDFHDNLRVVNVQLSCVVLFVGKVIRKSFLCSYVVIFLAVWLKLLL